MNLIISEEILPETSDTVWVFQKAVPSFAIRWQERCDYIISEPLATYWVWVVVHSAFSFSGSHSLSPVFIHASFPLCWDVSSSPWSTRPPITRLRPVSQIGLYEIAHEVSLLHEDRFFHEVVCLLGLGKKMGETGI